MDRLSPREIEAIVSGREVEDPAAEPIAALLKELRSELAEDPSPEATWRHLSAMKDAARAGEEASPVTTRKTRRKSMRTRGQRRLAGLVAAATLVLGGGIAAAVTLPDQASDTAKDAVSNGGDNAEHGQGVSETARDPALEGCEKGQAVAGQASVKAGDHRQGPKADPCARGDGDGDGANASRQGSGGGSGGPTGGGGGGGSELGGAGSGGPGGGSGGPSGDLPTP